MTWTFVLKDKNIYNWSWWLKITTLEDLLLYIRTVNPGKFEDIFNEYDDSEYILENLNGFIGMIAHNQWNRIQETGAIYINEYGDYHGNNSNDKIFSEILRTKLIYPNFKNGKIRVKKFSDENYFHAYIDDVEILNNEDEKWLTHREAYNAALKVIENE